MHKIIFFDEKRKKLIGIQKKVIHSEKREIRGKIYLCTELYTLSTYDCKNNVKFLW